MLAFYPPTHGNQEDATWNGNAKRRRNSPPLDYICVFTKELCAAKAGISIQWGATELQCLAPARIQSSR